MVVRKEKGGKKALQLQAIFSPRSMAVIGVSAVNDRHPATIIYRKNVHRYPIRVYAVNPKGGAILEEPIYKDISSIPETPDLAVIAVRAEAVPGVLADCIRTHVKGAIVVSGGFAETGRHDLQDEITALCSDAGFPVVGPNCLGVYVPNYLDTFFLPSERIVKPHTGNVAVVSQSGGILVDLMIKFYDEGVGLSRAMSIGNKAVIGEVDLLRHFARDTDTKVIAFYIEGFKKNEGREFVLAAGRCGKPVVVLKSGKSDAGAKAVSSHTASLAGEYASFSAALAQHGIVEAANELELVSFCEALSAYQKPISGAVGIVTGSGGHGALAVDACVRRGLALPSPDEEAIQRIRGGLSASVGAIASIRNPADLTGSAVDEDFVVTVEAFCAMKEIDCVIVLLLPYVPGITADLGSRLSITGKASGKALIAYVPHVDKYRMLIEGFELNGIPVSPSIEGAVAMASALRKLVQCQAKR